MDPFLETYCLACHNVWMYCDCVYSYTDVIPEDATSHESEGEGEDDDDEVDLEAPDFYDDEGGYTEPSKNKRPSPDAPLTPARPDKKPDSKPTPSKDQVVITDKPKPMAGNPGPVVAQQDPVPGYTYKPWEDIIADNLKRPGAYQTPKRPVKRPDSKPTPSKVPPTDDPATIALRYFEPNTGRPYPFLTSPSINKIVDNYQMPIYTGPQNPTSPEWTDFLNDELFPWYENLPDDAKSLYMEACFTSDPQDGVQSGDGPYYHVSIKYDHGAGTQKRNAEYVYTIRPIDGSSDPVVVYSDYRLPPRAFSGKESLDKYFFKDGDGDYFPRYKEERNKSSRRDPWYEVDAVGARMALKPNSYEGSTDVAPPQVVDPSLPYDPPIVPPPPPFHNAPGNTESINGRGFFDDPSTKYQSPFFNLGYISTNWYKSNHGNFRNNNSVGGFIYMESVSSDECLYMKDGAPNILCYHSKGVDFPSGGSGFTIHMDLINKDNPGRTMYALCYCVCTTTQDCAAFDVYPFVDMKGPGFYKPAVYSEFVLGTHENGSPRAALEQMGKISNEEYGLTAPVVGRSFGPMSAGSEFQFCFMVSYPNNAYWLESLNPSVQMFSGIRVGIKSSGIVDFRFDLVSSLWRENTRRKFLLPKSSLPGGVGYMPTTFRDYDMVTINGKETIFQNVNLFTTRDAVKDIGLYRNPDTTRNLLGSVFTVAQVNAKWKGKKVMFIHNFGGRPKDWTQDVIRITATDNATAPLLNMQGVMILILDIEAVWAPMPSGSVPWLPLDNP